MEDATARISSDYVIATGRQESVRTFVELSANALGWNKNKDQGIIWEGEGLKKLVSEQTLVK